MNSRVSRRSLLWGGAHAAGLVLGHEGVADAAAAPAALVFVRLRGGADGLSLLVPHTDESYYRARPSTAVRYASASHATELALDSRFALHPRLAPLRSWFAAGELGAIVGVGFPELERSHLNAQRALDATIARAVGGVPALGPGRPSRAPKAWVDQLLSRGPRATLCLDLDGWDLHAGQGDASHGRQAEACDALVTELVALKAALGAALARVLVVVVTEYGRSLRETPLHGTDDGHASLMLVLGGARRWGRVLGEWRGLAAQDLSGGRHVQPTTDIRAVVERLARGEAVA